MRDAAKRSMSASGPQPIASPKTRHSQSRPSVPVRTPSNSARLSPTKLQRAHRKFLRAFPGGFRDESYIDWERAYKWNAHLQWEDALAERGFRALINESR